MIALVVDTLFVWQIIVIVLLVWRRRRYEAALLWYADWLNYHRDYSTGKDKSLAEYDEGSRARAALGEKY